MLEKPNTSAEASASDEGQAAETSSDTGDLGLLLSEEAVADNPRLLKKLLDAAAAEPIAIIVQCQKLTKRLEHGYQRQARRTLVLAYAAAHHIAKSETNIQEFTKLVERDGLITKKEKEQLRDRLLFWVFDVVYVRSRACKRNTAYRYAYGLQREFDAGIRLEDMEKRIMKYGPERLYQDAVKKNKINSLIANDAHESHVARAKLNGDYARELLSGHASSNFTTIDEKDDTVLSPDDADEDADGQADNEVDENDRFQSRIDGEALLNEIQDRFDKTFRLAARLADQLAQDRALLYDEPLPEDVNYGSEVVDRPKAKWRREVADEQFDAIIRGAIGLSGAIREQERLLREAVRMHFGLKVNRSKF